QGGAHEVVGIVDYQSNARMILLIDSPRILRGNDDCALDLSVAYIFHRLFVVVVVDGHEGSDVGAHRVEGLADLECLRAAVLVHQPYLGVANLAAEGVPQDDQLHQGKYHRHQHQGGRTEELAHFALDDSQHSIHGCNPGLGGITKPCAFTSSSRNCRPV